MTSGKSGNPVLAVDSDITTISVLLFRFILFFCLWKKEGSEHYYRGVHYIFLWENKYFGFLDTHENVPLMLIFNTRIVIFG